MPLPLNDLYDLHCYSTDYVPALKGATDDPTVTASITYGEYLVIGSLCWFTIEIVVTTMTKSTTTDAIRASLPFAAANVAFTHGDVRCEACGYSATPNKNANQGRIPVGASYVELWNIPSSGAAPAAVTYGSSGAGLGVIGGACTFEISGCYRIDT